MAKQYLEAAEKAFNYSRDLIRECSGPRFSEHCIIHRYAFTFISHLLTISRSGLYTIDDFAYFDFDLLNTKV